jgi:hypothetical protein
MAGQCTLVVRRDPVIGSARSSPYGRTFRVGTLQRRLWRPRRRTRQRVRQRVAFTEADAAADAEAVALATADAAAVARLRFRGTPAHRAA